MCITGHIYKIIHLDSEIQYIGSTCDSISGRWRTHKMGYKYWLSNKEKYSTIAIFPYFQQYSIDRFKMILIKSYDVVDKKHLRVYEQLTINRTKCVNQQAAFQLVGTNCMSKHNKKLYCQANKDKFKEYYQANKQSISEQRKVYKAKNRDKLSEYKKSYRDQNKQSIKEKASVKVTCECGVTIAKSSLYKHRKTQKHLAALSN